MSFLLFAGDNFFVAKISPNIQERMIQGKSWNKSCPVSLQDLRYLRLRYRDFQGKTQMGEMIVHKTLAFEVGQIFSALYENAYPIRKIQLVLEYQANDWKSIEAGNTSAFNCRRATGSQKWSKHAYGKAIDLNPIENPYISGTGYIAHKASLKYKIRAHDNKLFANKAMLLANDKTVEIFKKYGWKWGGDWKKVKDYQHFSK